MLKPEDKIQVNATAQWLWEYAREVQEKEALSHPFVLASLLRIASMRIRELAEGMVID